MKITESKYLCINCFVVCLDNPCPFSSDHNILVWFHKLFKLNSDKQL